MATEQPKRRQQRLNDQIRDEISDLLQRHVKDPRLTTMVSITDVELSPDMRHAKVFASIMGDEEEQRSALRALRSAEGYLRREVAKRIQMRFVPELHFEHDTSIERGARILQMLKEVAPETSPDAPPAAP